MRAGKLNKRISIQTPTKTFEKGQQTETWNTLSTVWSQVKNISSNTSNPDALLQMDTITEFTVRYYPNITNDARILYKNNPYKVTGFVHTDESNRETVITTTRII